MVEPSGSAVKAEKISGIKSAVPMKKRERVDRHGARRREKASSICAGPASLCHHRRRALNYEKSCRRMTIVARREVTVNAFALKYHVATRDKVMTSTADMKAKACRRYQERHVTACRQQADMPPALKIMNALAASGNENPSTLQSNAASRGISRLPAQYNSTSSLSAVARMRAAKSRAGDDHVGVASTTGQLRDDCLAQATAYLHSCCRPGHAWL